MKAANQDHPYVLPRRLRMLIFPALPIAIATVNVAATVLSLLAE